MTTETLIQKMKRLEERVKRVERLVTSSPIQIRKPLASQSLGGLRMLAGIWGKKPRTKHDLQRVRKQLWK